MLLRGNVWFISLTFIITSFVGLNSNCPNSTSLSPCRFEWLNQHLIAVGVEPECFLKQYVSLPRQRLYCDEFHVHALIGLFIGK